VSVLTDTVISSVLMRRTMKTGRPVRNPPAKPMVNVGTLAAELGLSDRAAILVLNHLGVTAVRSSHDAVSSDVAEKVRRFESTGGVQQVRERFSTLSEAALVRLLDPPELDELLSLASALATVQPQHFTPLLREIPQPAAPPPLFSSEEIPAVEVPVATPPPAAIVFSSGPTQSGEISLPQNSVAQEAAPRAISLPVPPAAPTPSASPFPRRTCNLCRVDFYSEAPSHGCAGDRRRQEQVAATAGLPPVRGVDGKRVRRPSAIRVDEDRPRRSGWIVSGGHPGSGRRHR
jgi:hypothetical protein